MKRYLYIILITIVFLILGGCSNNLNMANQSLPSNENTDVQKPTSKENVPEGKNQTLPMNENKSESKLLLMEDMPKDKLEALNISYNTGRYYNYFSFENSTVKGNTVYLEDYSNRSRKSTKLMYMNDNMLNFDSFQANIDDLYDIDIRDFVTPYEISNPRANVTFKGYIENSPVTIIDNYVFGYDISNITVNAFIKKNDDSDTYDIIIDPFSMDGIPVYHKSMEFCVYNINNHKIIADTLQLTGSIDMENTSQEDKASFSSLNNDYVYAYVEIDKLSVNYVTDSNGTRYENKATIKSCSLVNSNADIDAVLKGDIVPQLNAAGSDENMRNIYDVMVNKMKFFYDSNVSGISLIDLDFDTIPELLVTHEPEIPADDSLAVYYDVDIYKFDNNKFSFIDTLYLYSYSSINDCAGEVIGLKKLEDGSNQWSMISYIEKTSGAVKPVHYLFILENNEILYTEVFRIEFPEENQDGSAQESEEQFEDNSYDYYYYGELMNFDIVEEQDEETGEIKHYYAWNGYRDEYRKCAIFNQLRDEFYKDMNGYEMLDDDFFIGERYGRIIRSLDKRTLLNKFAAIIDNYYTNGSSSEFIDINYYFGNNF